MERQRLKRSPARTRPSYRRVEGDPLSLEEIFNALASKRRRCLLYALRDGEVAASVEEVRDQLAEWEAEQGVTPDGEHCRQLDLTLFHTHLPKLDRMGVLDFDARTETIRYHGHPLLEQWLVQTREMDGV